MLPSSACVTGTITSSAIRNSNPNTCNARKHTNTQLYEMEERPSDIRVSAVRTAQVVAARFFFFLFVDKNDFVRELTALVPIH